MDFSIPYKNLGGLGWTWVDLVCEVLPSPTKFFFVQQKPHTQNQKPFTKMEMISIFKTSGSSLKTFSVGVSQTSNCNTSKTAQLKNVEAFYPFLQILSQNKKYRQHTKFSQLVNIQELVADGTLTGSFIDSFPHSIIKCWFLLSANDKQVRSCRNLIVLRSFKTGSIG